MFQEEWDVYLPVVHFKGHMWLKNPKVCIVYGDMHKGHDDGVGV